MNKEFRRSPSPCRRVGVIELIAYTVASEWESLLGVAMFKRQLYGVMPQVIAVWARELGHRVTYATYVGQQRPDALLPDDLDIVIVSASTQASALAYALARLYRSRGVTTVIGGPHAKSFPEDCSRFFDITVKNCDRALLGDILKKNADPGTILDTNRAIAEFPSVEARLPELKIAAFRRGRPAIDSVISLFSSTGCPYGCDFCSDWRTHYARVPDDRLRADVAFVGRHFPGAILGFQDPNFGIRMDDVLTVLEGVTPSRRSPYLMQCSLAALTKERLTRLRATKCLYVAPGIESWNEFGAKQGTNNLTGAARVERLVRTFDTLRRAIPGSQANFVMGLDSDTGDEPFELTARFIAGAPLVWPNINILTPYGGTPLHAELARQGRLLPKMPLALYCSPYLCFVPCHYDAVEFYDRFIHLLERSVSSRITLRRAIAHDSPALKMARFSQTVAVRRDIAEMRTIRDTLKVDPNMRAFHEGRSTELPPLYLGSLRKRLDELGSLLTPDDLHPVQPLVAPARERHRYLEISSAVTLS